MRPPYRVLFTSSLSVLAFEILLIRLFSISLSYHYAALIISISMMGLVLGALLVRFTGGKPFRLSLSPHDFLGYLAFILSLSYPIVFLVLSIIPLDHHRMLWEHAQLLYLLLFILICSVPFFIYGVIICIALSSWADKVPRVYAADLLGAACGVALALVLLDSLKIEYVIIIVSALPYAVAFIDLLHERLLRLPMLVPPILLYGLIGSGFVSLPISPYKGLMQALKDDDGRLVTTTHSAHSRVDIFENPRMKFAPGLSLTYTEPVPAGQGIAVDGDIAGVLIDETPLRDYRFLAYMPSALPYLLGKPRNVVVVGLRNSLDVLQPYYLGASNVYKAEQDPSIVNLIRKRYGPESRYGRFLYCGSGRNVMRKVPVRPDIIFISRTGFFPSGAFGLQEDYDTTVEALKIYLSHLHEKGILFIQMFIVPPPRYELRMMNTIVAALKDLGASDVSCNVLVYRSWDTMNFLVKKTAFSPGDMDTALQFLASRQLDLLYPAMENVERFIGGIDYETLFRHVATLDQREPFVETYPFDIRGTTDDRPFFHYFLKLSSVMEIYNLTGRKWAYFLHEGMALPFIFIFLLVISAVVFGIAFLISRRRGPDTGRDPELTLDRFQDSVSGQTRYSERAILLYFGLIGLSFMFIEIFFIHKLILPFSSPVRAFSITLVTVLLSSGAGSLISASISPRKVFYLMVLVPFWLLLCLFFFGFVAESVFAFLPIIPLAIGLGFFFPTGMRSISDHGERSIALAYALNGTASIIAPPLASIIGVALGLKSLLLLAAILYGVALLLIRRKTRDVEYR